MTSLAIRSGGATRLLDTSIPRIVMPSRLRRDDTLAAWEMYTMADSVGAHHLVSGGATSLDDGGALVFGSGSGAYAMAGNLVLPTAFSVIASVWLGAGTGAIFGNYVSTTTGFRLYASSSAIMAKVGDDAGRASLALAPAGWIDLGVSYQSGAIILCTEALSTTSQETSPLGTGVCRFGSQEASGVTAPAAMRIACAAVHGAALSLDALRQQIALAKAKRLKDGWV